MSSEGSSSDSRRSDANIFSSSALCTGSTANEITGAGSGSGSTGAGLSTSASTSPVAVSFSFGTAPIMPVPSSSVGS